MDKKKVLCGFYLTSDFLVVYVDDDENFLISF